MTTRVRIAAAALVIIAIPSLAGCWSGKDANTNVQATMNSGNGIEQRIGDLDVENATIVLGPEGSNSATLLASIVDIAGKGDKLIGAAINGKPAQIFSNGTLTQALEVKPNSTVKLGWDASDFVNTYELDVPVSTYVPVELVFERNGIVKFSLLTVPAAGLYEGIAPSPTAPVAAAS